MKKFLAVLLGALLVCCAVSACAQDAFEVLPAPEPNPESEFGVDVNVNVTTIDEYLGLENAVYRDARMPVDPYDYEAIGGNSILTGTVEGFVLAPYPYLAPCLNMPEALGEGYQGPTLFSIDENGHYAPNYEESMAILEAMFPKDQAILIMCGAGGYAGMTKGLLIDLGWDANMIFNVGGYWFYEGTHNVPHTLEETPAGVYRFEGLDIFEFDFGALTPIAG